MAALDFPNSPTVGQTFAPGGGALSYMWDGTRWRIAGGLGSPSGAVGYAQVTASQSGIGATSIDITGLSVTWTADPARRYRISVQLSAWSGVAGDDVIFSITDPAGNVKAIHSDPALDPSIATGFYFAAVETGLSGSTTRKVIGRRGAGSGGVTMDASPTYPAFILVEDITYQPGGGGGTAVGTSGLEAAKPSAPPAGSRYFATDTKRDWLYDGTGWIIMSEPEQSYVPAFGGTAQGNGVLTGAYHRSDGWVDFFASFELGTTSGVSGAGGSYATLPFAAKRLSAGAFINAGFADTGSYIYPAVTFVNGSGQTVVHLYSHGTAATYANGLPLTATNPFTWGATDRIEVGGRYPMNNKYT